MNPEINGEYYRKLPAWLTPEECNEIGSLALDALWVPGRQEGGYFKSDLLREPEAEWVIDRALDVIGNPAEFDAWLLHYPVGSSILRHVDPSRRNKSHVRLNALITSGKGGVLSTGDEQRDLTTGDAYVFRPDLVQHNVSIIEESPRYVLSVGANIEYEQARALGLAR